MDISKSALPPIQPAISDEDRKHPRFFEYQAWRSNMSRMLLEASSFKDWLASEKAHAESDQWKKHPQYKDFVRWMRDEQGGGRDCPAGFFPKNFQYWLTGARW